MNLHLCRDQKVISRTIQYFEDALPGQNKYVVLPLKKGQGCTFVKETGSFVHLENYNTKGFWESIGDVKQYDNIIFHSFIPEFSRFALSLSIDSPITWIIWGADLYNNLLVKRGYRLYAYEHEMFPKTILGRIRWLVEFPIKQIKHHIEYKQQLKALRKVKYVCGCEGDLKLLYQYYPEIKPFQKKDFFYYPVNDIIGKSLKNMSCTGNNIIVGNSASYTNNHRYVFEKLKSLNLRSRQVIVPLSYGMGKDAALDAGQLIKKNFQPVLDFLPLDDYNKMLASASTFIYGNFRQEAVGNIVIAFYLGGAVFLDQRNPLLHDLKKAGYIVYTLDQLEEKIDYVLTEVERKHNRELVLKLNNRDLMLSYIKDSFG